MAGRVMPMRIGDVELLVETTPVAGSEPTSALSRVQDAVAGAYERAQAAIVAVASSTVDVIGQLDEKAARPELVEVDRRLPGFLGRVLDAAGESAGTCFQVVPGVLVTAWHVLDDLRAGDVDAVVRVDPLHDLAVLVVGEPLVGCVPGLAAYQ